MGSGKLFSISRGCTAITQGPLCSRKLDGFWQGFCNGYAKLLVNAWNDVIGALKTRSSNQQVYLGAEIVIWCAPNKRLKINI